MANRANDDEGHVFTVAKADALIDAIAGECAMFLTGHRGVEAAANQAEVWRVALHHERVAVLALLRSALEAECNRRGW